MMKKLFFIAVLFFSTATVFAQKDSLQLGEKYWEDQLYINVSYNVLTKQPKEVRSSGFAFGLSTGYIKDISLNKRGNYAIGIGLGYNYDTFNHGVKVVVNNNSESFVVDSSSTINRMRLHNLEVPIQFRWRTSDAKNFSFWRIYTGLVVRYNLSNNFTNITEISSTRISNINSFNDWQTALTLSAGYGTFNFYVSYGLSPIFKNATLNGNTIDTSVLKLGFSFYLL